MFSRKPRDAIYAEIASAQATLRLERGRVFYREVPASREVAIEILLWASLPPRSKPFSSTRTASFI